MSKTSPPKSSPAAGKGAKKPEKVLDCKDGLEYFQTKSSLGCRKVKAAKAEHLPP